jgi:alpha-beta hydrolase superfamily lysophospholipase
MVKYTLWDTAVDIQIPYKPFPSVSEIKDIDSLFPSSLKHGYFLSKSTGCKLHYRVCLPPPEEKLKGILVFQHGIMAHSGTAFKLKSGRVTNYALLANSMVKAGYALYLLDMYGHG